MYEVNGVIRDKSSGGVLSVQNASLEEYKKRRNMLREKNNKIENLEKRLSAIEGLLSKLDINREK